MVSAVSLRFAGRQTVIGTKEQLDQLEKTTLDKAQAAQTDVVFFKTPEAFYQQLRQLNTPDAKPSSWEAVKKEADKNPLLKNAWQTFMTDWWGPGLPAEDSLQQRLRSLYIFTGEDARQFRNMAPLFTTVFDGVLNLMTPEKLKTQLMNSAEFRKMAEENQGLPPQAQLQKLLPLVLKTSKLPEFLKRDLDKLTHYSTAKAALQKNPKIQQLVGQYLLGDLLPGLPDTKIKQDRETLNQLLDEAAATLKLSPETLTLAKFVSAPWIEVLANFMPKDIRGLGQFYKQIPKTVSADKLLETLATDPQLFSRGYGESLVTDATQKVDMGAAMTLLGHLIHAGKDKSSGFDPIKTALLRALFKTQPPGSPPPES